MYICKKGSRYTVTNCLTKKKWKQEVEEQISTTNEISFILKHNSCTTTFRSTNNWRGRTTCKKNMSILGLFSQFLIVWITQTWQSFKVISYYVHVYNTLLCKTKMYLFLHFTLLVKLFETYLIHYCWFGFLKKPIVGYIK